MAPSREIEKLQRRWQENPLGLTFAPLAEAYRKEGMFADALDLLEIGLAQHPSYVPAHIVKGRCFLDAQSDSQAEVAFLRVAELDPENVIALKGLADIAERAGRFDEASTRLERLLDYDRNNEDARVQLDRLKAHRVAPTPEDGLVDAGEVATPAPPPPIQSEPLPEPAWTAVPEAEATPAPVADVPPPPEEPPLVVPAELPRAEIIAEVARDVEVVVYSPVELTAANTGEFQQSNDAETLEPASAVDSFVADLAAMPAVDDEVEVEGESVVEDEAAAEAPASEPELVVTETMAEVFLRQGHRELALAVYSQLASREPANARIREAIGRLETELRPNRGAVIPAYAAVLTGGQSVRAFFEQLLAERRPGTVSEADGLSLGEVFGDGQSAGGSAATIAPDPSFDEFYGDSPETLPPTPISPPPADAAAATGGDDLEGFTDWLKGLRR